MKCTVIRNQEDIHSAIEALTADINAGIKNATLTHPVTKSSRKLLEDVLQLIKKRNRMRFKYQRHEDRVFRAKLNALQRESMAHLGNITDNSFDDFLSETESQRNSAWKMVRSLRNRQSRLPPLKYNNQSFSITSNAMIRSIASYGILIWGSAEPHHFGRLQGTYMRILRSTLKIPWLIRNEQMLSETGVPSIQQLTTKYAILRYFLEIMLPCAIDNNPPVN